MRATVEIFGLRSGAMWENGNTAPTFQGKIAHLLAINTGRPYQRAALALLLIIVVHLYKMSYGVLVCSRRETLSLVALGVLLVQDRNIQRGRKR